MDKPFLHNTTQRSFMVDCAKEQKDLSDMNDERLETAFQIVDEVSVKEKKSWTIFRRKLVLSIGCCFRLILEP